MTERLPYRARILDRPVRPRGRCSRPLEEPCRCWRPRFHDDECRCTCQMYGSVHGVVAVPANHAGALVTDAAWGFNTTLRRLAERKEVP